MTAKDDWFRDSLICPGCNSVVRERALALVLDEVRPEWRSLAVHESSPANRGLSAKLAEECARYEPSQFFADVARGVIVDGVRSEDLQAQTFPDQHFDLVITLDVMEHTFDPEAVYREIWRTLKPGGCYIHTFPIQKALGSAFNLRATLRPDGSVTLLEPPEYHGNPIDPTGSLVTLDYGYDIHKQISAWAPFDVRVNRFSDYRHGVIGEFTDVVVCYKRGEASRL